MKVKVVLNTNYSLLASYTRRKVCFLTTNQFVTCHLVRAMTQKIYFWAIHPGHFTSYTAPKHCFLTSIYFSGLMTRVELLLLLWIIRKKRISSQSWSFTVLWMLTEVYNLLYSWWFTCRWLVWNTMFLKTDRLNSRKWFIILCC